MAGKRRRGCCLGRLLGLMLLALALLTGYMAVQSRIVCLETAQVYLKDLPEAFDGVTVLLLTDLHVGAFASGDETAGLMDELQNLYPDLLLLGGDFSGADPFSSANQEDTLAQRDSFFRQLSWFYAPLGKFAVRGNHDRAGGLSQALSEGGVSLLVNQVARLEKEGQYLYLAGLDDWNTGNQDYASVAAAVSPQDAVLVLSHNPDSFPAALRQGDWLDLMLCGHTHGGQINLPLLSRFVTPSIYGDAYRSGWVKEKGALLLVSNGVGCTWLPLRFNAPAQVHLLTLRRA